MRFLIVKMFRIWCWCTAGPSVVRDFGTDDHLQIGSQRDNKHDDWVHAAYGTDPDFL